ncbi:MAG TPA: L,D-transpeptidase family protein [Thermoanaerobaculia bacterium]|nr:L,D-transpeptidase family protein [Thermoanaerobaculia bacterium]
MRRWQSTLLGLLLIAGIAAGGDIAYARLVQGPTLADALRRYGAGARTRMRPYIQRAGIAYPPKRLALLVFKRERRLSIWAEDRGWWRFLRAYPILAASGDAGPKLREGDYQVPEGLYRIAWLNPTSSYHLSMKVDYPNAFDRSMAATDGRTRLGGDIFIHGKNVSIGCVAIGDPQIEELFTLVADTGVSKVRVVIAPNDLRSRGAIAPPSPPFWIGKLYASIAAALRDFPIAEESDLAFDVRGMRKEPKVFTVH